MSVIHLETLTCEDVNVARDTEPVVPLNGTLVDRVSGGTESAARVADVLLLFVSGPEELGVSEISRKLDLSKAVVHRILQSLVSRELLQASPRDRGYRLGVTAVALGARALRDLDIRRIARPLLQQLATQTEETSTLSTLLGSSRMYLEQVESRNEIKMTVEIGKPLPLHAGASGRAILAFAEPSLRASVLAGDLPQLTPRTVTERNSLVLQLRRVRETHIAVSLGERQADAGSVAAPIIGVDGFAVGSFSVCGPISRLDSPAFRRISPLVFAAAQQASTQMGWDSNRPVPSACDLGPCQ